VHTLSPTLDKGLGILGTLLTVQDIMGTNKANPSAMILSATMMLRHLGLEAQANDLASAVYEVIAESKVRTADMHGSASTSDFTKAVLDKVMS